MSKFKAKRPDPVEALKQMRELVEEVHTRDIELQNVLAEIAENNKKYREAGEEFNQIAIGLNDERTLAVNAYNDVRDRCMKHQIECLAIFIEDMLE